MSIIQRTMVLSQQMSVFAVVVAHSFKGVGSNLCLWDERLDISFRKCTIALSQQMILITMDLLLRQ